MLAYNEPTYLSYYNVQNVEEIMLPIYACEWLKLIFTSIMPGKNIIPMHMYLDFFLMEPIWQTPSTIHDPIPTILTPTFIGNLSFDKFLTTSSNFKIFLYEVFNYNLVKFRLKISW